MSALIPSLSSNAERAPEVSRAVLVLLFALAMSAMSANTPGWSRSQAAVEPALEPEEAGADFPIQGEYLGKVANVTPMGAQVIALGGGTFKAVFLAGGLPGQGWNGKDRVEAAGTLAGGQAGFSGGGYSATVAADGYILSGTTDKGEPFTFDKIHRKSPTEGAPPPAGAIVLFDGSGVAAWKDGSAGIDARDLFRPVGAASTAGAVTKAAFQDFTLHLEFRVPFQPTARYTSRGNSGVYLQSRYEVQVLDSFGSNLAVADTMTPKRECGAIFEHFAPRIGMSYPPLSWQTFDIAFTAARFDAGGQRIKPANVTVLHNGEPVQDKRDMLNRTLAGELEGAAAGPLKFQAYDSPVFYRNIWITDGLTAIGIRSRGREGREGNKSRKSGPGTGAHRTQGAIGTATHADGRAVTAESILSGKIPYSRGATDDF